MVHACGGPSRVTDCWLPPESDVWSGPIKAYRLNHECLDLSRQMEVVCLMSKFRLLLLSFFAVLAVSAVASASASALAYLVGNHEVLAGEKFLTLSEQLSNAVLSASNVEITCTHTTDLGLILASGLSSALVHFTNCTVQKPSSTCHVAEPILVNAVDKLVSEGGIILDSFVPASGKTFVTLHFTTCSLETIEVEGMARGVVEALTMQLKNTLTFAPSNQPLGLLKTSGKAATFALTEDVWLANDANWGVLD